MNYPQNPILYRPPTLVSKMNVTIINKYNGFIVKYNDHKSLVNAVEKFLKQKTLIKKFGNNSRKRAIKYFDVKIVNKKILNIIQY